MHHSEIQFHPVTDRIVHIDLLEIIPGKEVKVNLPFVLKEQLWRNRWWKNGNSFPSCPYGSFRKPTDALSADVSALNIGDTLRVGDLILKVVTFFLTIQFFYLLVSVLVLLCL